MAQMAAAFPAEPFPLMDDVGGSPAPQLVMLANVAAVAAADGAEADGKEMVELKTVACGYSDSEDEGVIGYGYESRDGDAPVSSPSPVACAAREQNGGGEAGGQFPGSGGPRPPATAPAEGGKKRKKPFHCKPCRFQAHGEDEFVEHLRTHALSKMAVVHRVEGRSKAKEAQAAPDGPGEGGGEGEALSGDAKGLIRCERCGYNTNRYDHYVAHLKHHSKEGDDHRVFKCTLCAYSTVSQYHWRKHLRNHFPSKLHTCAQCSYFSDRKSNYIQHIRTHTGVRPFRCPYCDYSSSQKTHLTRHMRTHSGERPFKCDSCNYLAANQHEVTRHARQVHNGPKPLACPYCEYKTADRSNFKKHVELHLNPRQFLCPLCKYAASKKCNLQYHIKSRHSGCSVTVDVSKVKLRVKRPERPARARAEEDAGGRGPGGETLPADKPPGPVDLSLGRDGGEEEIRRGENPEKAARETRQKKSGENPEDAAPGAAKAKKRGKKATGAAGDGPESERPATGGRRDGKPRRACGRKSDRGELLAGRGAAPEGPGKDGGEKSQKRKAARALDLSRPSAPKARRAQTGKGSPSTAKRSFPSGSPAKRSGRSAGKTSGRPRLSRAPGRSAPAQATDADAMDPPPAIDLPPAMDAMDPSPAMDAPPTPAQPSSAPPPEASEPEDDEGVHSSHEGGDGDVSDGASEGSDDSGLNGNGAGAGKASERPPTPAAPTEVKGHTCIFCDRHFPAEPEYRRHLKRHLVNVYYMSAAPASD
ncbi:RE1-silencing transcription factor [Hippocampus zosterae]|uniref:RE1-silencing transcription factor n=1 Tax=Hippocampus zosterae TaxID=109293 RepID=UPI00223CA5D4|nr:RE1-silencing transcription factor [Hippocampus zosterae]